MLAVLLLFQMSSELVDVNVTPDKQYVSIFVGVKSTFSASKTNVRQRGAASNILTLSVPGFIAQ